MLPCGYSVRCGADRGCIHTYAWHLVRVVVRESNREHISAAASLQRRACVNTFWGVGCNSTTEKLRPASANSLLMRAISMAALSIRAAQVLPSWWSGFLPPFRTCWHRRPAGFRRWAESESGCPCLPHSGAFRGHRSTAGASAEALHKLNTTVLPAQWRYGRAMVKCNSNEDSGDC